MGRRRAAAAVENSAFYQERRQAIIDAAARVFQAQGYEATSLVHVANELNTDRASLYYYASSKKELFEEVVRQASQANVETVEAIARSEGSPTEKLRSAFKHLMESYASDYPYFRWFIQLFLQNPPSGTGRQPSENRDWAERYYQAIRSILQEGVDTGEFKLGLPVGIATIGVIGTMNWIQLARVGELRSGKKNAGRLSATDIGLGLADLILGGLAADKAVTARPRTKPRVRKLK